MAPVVSSNFPRDIVLACFFVDRVFSGIPSFVLRDLVSLALNLEGSCLDMAVLRFLALVLPRFRNLSGAINRLLDRDRSLVVERA